MECDLVMSEPDNSRPLKLADLIFTAPEEATTGEIQLRKYGNSYYSCKLYSHTMCYFPF